MFLHFLLHITGINDTSGPWYAFWSGFGSDLTEFAVIGVIYKHLNCKQSSCWRIGKHHVEGTPYKTCHKHTTVDVHRVLHSRHKHKHPKQHEMFDNSNA